jgi:cytidylate kinase
MPMCVITISRGLFSGGRALAQAVAQELGYRCVGRKVILERAAARGASHEELRDALEKPPGLIDRLSHKRYVFLYLLQAALAEEVRDGDVVYHGLAGHLLLRDAPRVLRIRLLAPLESRIAAAQDRIRFGRDEAEAHLKKMDDDRRKWSQYLYGVDWEDPSLYDLVVNLECMQLDQASRMVATLARQKHFEFGAECRQKMDELALQSRVRADLALHPSTARLELRVAADRGTISIRGDIPKDLRIVEEMKVIAGTVPGVTKVRLEA